MNERIRLNPGPLDLEQVLRNCLVFKKREGTVTIRKSRPKPKGEDFYGPSYYVWRMLMWETGVDRTMPWSATFYSDDETKDKKILLDYLVWALSKEFFEQLRPGDWMMGGQFKTLSVDDAEVAIQRIMYRALDKAQYQAVAKELQEKVQRKAPIGDDELQDWIVLGTDLGFIKDPQGMFARLSAGAKELRKRAQEKLPGINPAFVKTRRDERLWANAKVIVREEYDVKEGSKEYWALVNRVFHRMQARVGGGAYPPGKNPRTVGGIHVEWSPMNQAWFVMWNETVLRVFNAGDKELLKDYLKHDLGVTDVDIPPAPKALRRGNPGAIQEQYVEFHGTEPAEVLDLGTTWCPGKLVFIGHGVDIGYDADQLESEKEGRYVHDFGASVKVYRRARDDEKADATFHSFPHQVWSLGGALGFSYEGGDGRTHEVKLPRTVKHLCALGDRKTLVVVGPDGVEYLLRGGRMRVADWIYD